MRTFQVHPIILTLVVAILSVGAIAFFLVAPVCCINWLWNEFVANHSQLPTIGFWQSLLLYAAVACVLYITGLVRIEFKAENLD